MTSQKNGGRQSANTAPDEEIVAGWDPYVIALLHAERPVADPAEIVIRAQDSPWAGLVRPA